MIDYTGQVFGNLTILERVPYSKNAPHHKRRYWKCSCSCGEQLIVSAAHFTVGHTRSCGCIQTKTEPGESGLNQLYAHYKSPRRNKKVPFSLSKEEFKSLVQNNCYYCGIGPVSEISIGRTARAKEYSLFKYNGLDQVVPQYGYTKDNVVTCCIQCNHAKTDSSVEEFIMWAKRLVKNLENK